MNYQLDQDLMGEEYQEQSPGSSFVRLPFTAPILYWKHGNPDVQAINDVIPIQFYGRWNCGINDFDRAAKEHNIAPPKIIETRVVKSGGRSTGETYQVYAIRYLIFAVITSRKRWITNRTTGNPNSHSQVLAYMFSQDQESGDVSPAMPVILSAKVFAQQGLDESIKKWFSHITEFGVQIPAHYFYMAIGTFGKKSNFEGPHGTSTPPTLYIPQNLTADTLPFVGNKIARKMAELKTMAQDWLHDEEWVNFDSNQTKPAGRAPIANSAPQRDYQGDYPDEEIPF